MTLVPPGNEVGPDDAVDEQQREQQQSSMEHGDTEERESKNEEVLEGAGENENSEACKTERDGVDGQEAGTDNGNAKKPDIAEDKSSRDTELTKACADDGSAVADIGIEDSGLQAESKPAQENKAGAEGQDAIAVEAKVTDTLDTNEKPQMNHEITEQRADRENESNESGSSDSDSSSSESSDEDSDDSDESEGFQKIETFDGDDLDEMDENEGGGAAAKMPPKTKNEITPDEIGPVEKLRMHIEDSLHIRPLGSISAVVDNMVVVESMTMTSAPILDEGSILCGESRDLLGSVFETFGQVSKPFYTFRVHPEDMDSVLIGKEIFYVEEKAEIVHAERLVTKGCDASNLYDEEIPNAEQDYSDDEMENLMKRKASSKRRNTDGHGENAEASAGKGRRSRGKRSGDKPRQSEPRVDNRREAAYVPQPATNNPYMGNPTQVFPSQMPMMPPGAAGTFPPWLHTNPPYPAPAPAMASAASIDPMRPGPSGVQTSMLQLLSRIQRPQEPSNGGMQQQLPSWHGGVPDPSSAWFQQNGQGGGPGMQLPPGSQYPAGQQLPPGPQYRPGHQLPPGPQYLPGQQLPPGPQYQPGQQLPPGPQYQPGQQLPPGPQYPPGAS